MTNGNVPILGKDGNHKALPAGEIYIPGRQYELVAQLPNGDQVTIRHTIDIPPDKIPNPFIAEHVIVQWAQACRAQRAITKAEEGVWVIWDHITCFQFVGPVDTIADNGKEN